MIDPILAVGSPVWLFDENRRVYATRAPGSIGGGPIWREHWGKNEITAETKISWLVGNGTIKLPKRNPRLDREGIIAFSREEIDGLAWAHDHRHRIADKLRCMDDFTLLKQIAELIGYKAAP